MLVSPIRGVVCATYYSQIGATISSKLIKNLCLLAYSKSSRIRCTQQGRWKWAVLLVPANAAQLSPLLWVGFDDSGSLCCLDRPNRSRQSDDFSLCDRNPAYVPPIRLRECFNAFADMSKIYEMPKKDPTDFVLSFWRLLIVHVGKVSKFTAALTK